MSYIFKPDNEESQDPKLFSPFIRKFIDAPREVELEELPLKQTQVKENSELKIEVVQAKSSESQD